MSNSARYVLITSAMNEAETLPNTIASVLAQTKKPEVWIIINDSSTDQTESIIKDYSQSIDFIIYGKQEEIGGRNFARKANALNSGYEQISKVDFEYVGVLDADITVPTTYYEKIIERMEEDGDLGVAGGRVVDFINGTYVNRGGSPWSVAGGILVFKKACFESFNGFRPMVYGAEDTVAEIEAKIRGWKVHSFGDLMVLHHRLTGTAGGNVLKARFIDGLRDYSYGVHPLYEAVKFVNMLKIKPYLIGATARLAGYLWWTIINKEREVSEEIVKHLRKEQMERLINRIKLSLT